MNNLEFYIPVDIPPEVLVYDSELKQLEVGKAGKLGALTLGLEGDLERGKTVVKEQYSKVPLFTQRALYLEESIPSMAYIYIISPSGGILQGDRYRMDIKLKNNAYSHITTQGATRVYRMENNFATQIVNVVVDDGCYFEFVPDQIIPYRNSRFYQTVNLNVHDNATMVYSEMIVPGRVASGESFEYDICYMKALAKNQKGRIRFIDIAILEPKKRNLKTLGILGNFDVVGSMYILTMAKYVAELNEEINSSVQKFFKISGGATILPYNSGVLVRMLGSVASDLRNAMYEVIRITRKIILNASFSGIRKG
ncbi:MAG TPA: urease accessory protein UreD [Nitrososphaeraceae archaeon]|jgi:urease accessory protein|nr:urease accessory protein UreD [Nitrososphaeraceae archaeon]